jgi:hypothetical protein
MKTFSRRLALAAALAACGVIAQAQTPPPPAGMPPPGMHSAMPGGEWMHQHMQQNMQERMQRRMDSLKRILQVTPAQEGAWNAWSTAMRPDPAAMQQRHRMHEELARLTTPERIDRMRQLRAQRNAEMDRKAEATKVFYAQLTPAQQKAFDEISLRFFGRRGHRHGMGHGG